MSEHHLRDEAAHLAGDIVHETEQEVEGTAALLTADEQPTMLEAMGGPLGITESALPSVAFVIAYTAGMETTPAALVAVALAAVSAVARVIRKQTPQFAIAGVIGVGISAWIAHRTGEARNFFVLGLVANVAYAAIAFGSIAVRWPLVGVIVAGFGDSQSGWREDPRKMRAYRDASLMWGALFTIRLIVQVPLYIANLPGVLGTVKTIMGLPLFGLGVWLSWLILQRIPEDPAPAAAAIEADSAADAAPSPSADE